MRKNAQQVIIKRRVAMNLSFKLGNGKNRIQIEITFALHIVTIRIQSMTDAKRNKKLPLILSLFFLSIPLAFISFSKFFIHSNEHAFDSLHYYHYSTCYTCHAYGKYSKSMQAGRPLQPSRLLIIILSDKIARNTHKTGDYSYFLAASNNLSMFYETCAFLLTRRPWSKWKKLFIPIW